ncbi:MAG: cadherin-like beta sandwich domain-containing protein [Bacilli bacterium]|nr:cadherin-like beta sandwich domain-containing protein [Bacilli bacterium]
MKKKISKIIVLLVAMFFSITTTHAASYTVNSSTNIIKGGSGSLTINGSDVTGPFRISTSNSSVVSISKSYVWIENNSYRINLTALKVGTATITITPSGVSDSNGNYVTLPTKTITVTVSLPREKSKDNNLKSLSIEGHEISPAFNKDVQAYNVVVPEDTKEIVVNASPNEAHATIKGTGTIPVTSGINTVNVTVKSETGAEKIYSINVEVKDNNPIVVNVDNKEYTIVKLKENLTKPDLFDETTVNINGYEIPAFINRNIDITLVGLKDSAGNISLFSYGQGEYHSFHTMKLNDLSLIPISFEKELDLIKTTIVINDETFDAYKYSEKSELFIISAKSLKDGESEIYLYDPVKNSVVRYDDSFITEANDTIKNYTYIIFTFAGVAFVLLIMIFSLLHSLHKKQKKINKFVEKQGAKIEATRKLNDVIMEVKRITENENKANEKTSAKEETKAIKTEAPVTPKDSNEPKKSSSKKTKKAKDIVEVKEIQVSDPNNEIKKVLDDSEEVYDLFEDDRKKKKKKLK